MYCITHIFCVKSSMYKHTYFVVYSAKKHTQQSQWNEQHSLNEHFVVFLPYNNSFKNIFRIHWLEMGRMAPLPGVAIKWGMFSWECVRHPKFYNPIPDQPGTLYQRQGCHFSQVSAIQHLNHIIIFGLSYYWMWQKGGSLQSRPKHLFMYLFIYYYLFILLHLPITHIHDPEIFELHLYRVLMACNNRTGTMYFHSILVHKSMPW